MHLFQILFTIAVLLGLLILLISYLCYRLAFYVPRKKSSGNKKSNVSGNTACTAAGKAAENNVEEPPIDIPEGEIYLPFREVMENWVKEARRLPSEPVSVTSFDGLTLTGKYYECSPGAPIELMLHGYRGNAERDLSGGVQRCFSLGHNALVVDQRCSGGSGGHTITFGINEYRDCLTWVDFMVQHFGPEAKIILTGISMGASTVILAAGQPLPPNVIGALADCGFNSARDIIRKVIRQIGLPVGPLYPFIKLGARLFGHFDLEETSPEEAIRNCHIPVIFFHGETDDFVPCEMSRILYEACPTRKKLVTVPGAGHGLCYPVAPEVYLEALREFFDEPQILP